MRSLCSSRSAAAPACRSPPFGSREAKETPRENGDSLDPARRNRITRRKKRRARGATPKRPPRAPRNVPARNAPRRLPPPSPPASHAPAPPAPLPFPLLPSRSPCSPPARARARGARNAAGAWRAPVAPGRPVGPPARIRRRLPWPRRGLRSSAPPRLAPAWDRARLPTAPVGARDAPTRTPTPRSPVRPSTRPCALARDRRAISPPLLLFWRRPFRARLERRASALVPPPREPRGERGRREEREERERREERREERGRGEREERERRERGARGGRAVPKGWTERTETRFVGRHGEGARGACDLDGRSAASPLPSPLRALLWSLEASSARGWSGLRSRPLPWLLPRPRICVRSCVRTWTALWTPFRG